MDCAPPPPTLSPEQIEWLPPELENDDESVVTFANPALADESPLPDSEASPRPGFVGRAVAFLKRATGRHG